MRKNIYLLCCLILIGCTQDNINVCECDRFEREKNDEAAITCYSACIDKGTQNLQTHLKYINLLRRTNHIEKAATALTNAHQIFAPSYPIVLLQGKLFLDQGDIEAASAIFQKIIDQDRSDHVALNALAVAFDINHQYKATQKLYQKALKLLPDHPAYLTNLGLSLIGSKNYKQAVAILSSIRTHDHARDNLALAYAALGRKKDFHDLLTPHFNKEERDNLYKLLKASSL